MSVSRISESHAAHTIQHKTTKLKSLPISKDSINNYMSSPIQADTSLQFYIKKVQIQESRPETASTSQNVRILSKIAQLSPDIDIGAVRQQIIIMGDDKSE